MDELKIWMNGKLESQADAVLPVNSAAVFYATNVFEGLRGYWNAADEELYCFRLADHFSRFRESMKMMRFTIPYSDDDLYEAVRHFGNCKWEVVSRLHGATICELLETTRDIWLLVLAFKENGGNPLMSGCIPEYLQVSFETDT